jgi:hypothetical protein
MAWSTVLVILREAVADAIAKRRKRETELKDGAKCDSADGGVLARPSLKSLLPEEEIAIANETFQELWKENKTWAKSALLDALAFAKASQPRDSDTIDKALRPETYKSKEDTDSLMASSFAQTWQSLKNRGWRATLILDGDKAGKTKYEHEDKQVRNKWRSMNFRFSPLTPHVPLRSTGLTRPLYKLLARSTRI